jgi:hypothetical protein
VPNLVVIFGAPASGKAAVGHELARLTGYRFFHNHLTADPAAALFGWGGERFGRMVDVLRDLLFREAAADPAIPGVIFTYAWGLNLPEDTALMAKTSALFADAGGQVYFVELLARLETRLAREGTPFRVGLKPALRDVAAARERQLEFAAKFIMNTEGAMPLNYPHLVIDTEAMAPDAAATHVQRSFALAQSDA